MSAKPVAPKGWPHHITYLQRPAYSARLTSEQLQQIQQQPPAQPTLPIIKVPISEPSPVRIVNVTDDKHPAKGQCGLFADAGLNPDTFVLPYLGLVHSNTASDTDSASDYDLSLDREAEVSVDATSKGNEARFINDYRGVRDQGPNVEFRDIWMDLGGGTGGKGIGVFVLSAGKSGKRKGGVKKGEELLVSYGRGFWQERAFAEAED